MSPLVPDDRSSNDNLPEDGDSVFFFNYRSDRMREIASVFGLPDKPMEVDIPKNLVRLIALIAL